MIAAAQKGLDYDRDGLLARKGKVNLELLDQLNSHPYYQQIPPKSLGREFFERFQRQKLCGDTTANLLATFTEHIAQQIAHSAESQPTGKLLVTGGGALNTFLIERIQQHTHHKIVVPDRQIVDYKEALIFALLGLLRLEGRTNVLCSVTGAPSDSCSGRIWTPKNISGNNLVRF